MLDRPLQPLKALLPIAVKEAGKPIVFSEVSDSKALSPMAVMSSERVIAVAWEKQRISFVPALL